MPDGKRTEQTRRGNNQYRTQLGAVDLAWRPYDAGKNETGCEVYEMAEDSGADMRIVQWRRHLRAMREVANIQQYESTRRQH